MNNDLLLQSGKDIPFAKAKLVIHVPTMAELALLGEEVFFIGCELLNFSKDLLSNEDKSNLTNTDNFDVFMSIMKDKKTLAIQKSRICAMMILSLIFPDYKIFIQQDNITFIKEVDEVVQEGKIDKDNFEEFKEILVAMFCLKRKDDGQEYNPANEYARKLAEKMNKGRAEAAKAKGEMNKISIFNRYISILAVGLQKDKNDLMNYTPYQLCDEFERFELYQEFNIYIRAKMAGAKDLKEVDNWMKELHPLT